MTQNTQTQCRGHIKGYTAKKRHRNISKLRHSVGVNGNGKLTGINTVWITGYPIYGGGSYPKF